MAAVTGHMRTTAETGGGDGEGTGRDDRPRRRTLRRGSLPGGRALLGGLLVALSAVGLVATQRGSDEPAGTKVLIARRPIAAGATIASADLGWVEMSLYDGTARHAFESPDKVVGRAAAVPIAADELISSSMLAPASRATGRRVSIEVSSAAALGGSLVAGDRVDVVASGDTAATTAVIARDAVIASTPGDESEKGIGAQDRVGITLIVADEATAVAVLDAAASSQVALIGAAVAPELGDDS